MRVIRDREETGRPPAGDLLTLPDLVRFFRRSWLLVLASAAVAAVLAFALVLLLVPPRYGAAATLVVSPPTFRSQLKPQVLSVQGYQRILESGAVLAETVQRLQAAEMIEEGQSLRLGEELETRIFVSRRAEETALAPVIEAVGYGTTPEQAAAIANTWAEVFLENARRLLADSLLPTVELIEQQYTAERASLEDLEAQRRVETAQYRKRIDERAEAWTRRLLEIRQRTEDLVAAFQAETRGILLTFTDEQGIASPAAPGASSELDRKVQQILTLRIQLAQTPRLLVLEKAVPDEIIWQSSRGSGEGEDGALLIGRRLVTQETNPIYEELALRVSQVELDTGTLTAQQRRQLQHFVSGLERLQIDRSAGLAKLLTERELAIADLERRRAGELQDLQAELERRQEWLDRDIEHKTELYRKLALSHSEITLAQAELSAQDVRLGAAAVARVAPRRGSMLKIAVAAVLGGLLGLLIAVIREFGHG